MIKTALSTLNAAPDTEAADLLVPFMENAPALAARVAQNRPFADAETLAAAIRAAILGLSLPDLLALFRGHPELSPPDPAGMTRESQGEQARLGLTHADDALRARLADLNARYRSRFGFPFIVALHGVADTTALIATFETRLAAATPDEIAAACDQIASVSRARVLAALVPARVPA